MKKILSFFVAFLTLIAVQSALAQTAEELFQKGKQLEEVKGELEQAIAAYKTVVQKYPTNNPLAAKSLLHMGRCYEKLGKDEAQNAYERIIKQYPDQTDLVAQARTRLAALSAASETGRGLVARRVLSPEDTREDDFAEMYPSLDGRRVAYVNYLDGGVYVRDLASGDVQQLAAGRPAIWHNFPKWSPDGRRVAVGEKDQATRVTSIKLIDVATHVAVIVPGTQTLDTINGPGSINPAEWSRDGRSLLCVRQGHLVLIKLNDGAMTTLADSLRRPYASLSPDGRFAAYAVGREGSSRVFVQPVAGGPPRLIPSPQGNSQNPVWSPDGRAIAYVHSSGIWVVPVTEGASSGSPRQALVTGGINLRGWTEAGLYYTVWGTGMSVPYQVSMNPATGAAAGDVPQALPGRHPDQFELFTWSPDMQRVAFAHWHPAAISVYSASRGTVERFDVGQGYAERPSWSADGREVLIHVVTPSVPGTDTIRAVDPVSGRVRDLESRIPRGFGGSYSADGRTVAFVRQAPSAGTWQASDIVVAAAGASDGQVVATAGGAGGTSTRLTDWPWLSPRGDKVLYLRQDRQSNPPGPATLWVVGSDGGGTRQLATAARILSAAWDPSGRFIAYGATESTADSARTLLRVVDIGTGVDRQIPLPATFPRFLRAADWSRDGRLLGLVATTYTGDEYWVVQGLQEGVR